MSMISAQIDGLRERAKVLRQGRWSDGADDARLMEDAADTIWQLRDDLQRTHKLLDEAEHDESRAWDRVRKAEAEADKLREELAKARDPQRIGGQADPSSFVYAIEQLREFRWQHATNDEDAIPYINNVAAAHERENDKLREQGERLFDKTLELGTENDRLREQAARAWRLFLKHGAVHPFDLPEVDVVRDKMRELGVEVTE